MKGGNELRQLQHLCRTAAVGLALLDEDLRFVRVNDAFARMADQPLEGMAGSCLAELEPIADQLVPHCREVLAGGTSRCGVELTLAAGGTQAVWLVDFHPCQIEREPGVSFAVQDVTAVRRAEQMLDERLRFETLLSDLSAEFIRPYFEDLDRTIEANLQRIVIALELDRASLFDNRVDLRLACTHYWTREGCPAPAEHLRLEHLPWLMERLARGEPVFICNADDLPPEATAEREFVAAREVRSGVMVPLIAQGRLLGLLAFATVRAEREWSAELLARLRLLGEVFTNVLLRRRTVEALQESEERYRTLIEHAPEAIVIFDSKADQFIDANGKFREMFGVSEDSFSGLADLFPESQPDGTSSMEHARELLAQTLAGETPHFEWTHRDAAGREFLTEVNLVAVPPAERGLIRGSVTDISERKELEEQLHQARKMEAIGHLAGGVAHDFNNLLTAIQGNVEMGLARIAASDPLHHHLVEIGAAGDRATALTRQLLAFGRRQMIQPCVLSLNEVVDNLTRMLERVLGEHVKLVTVLEPSIGCVEADPHQIEQMIVNLAINARDAMPGGGTLTVLTTERELGPGEGPPEFDPSPGRYIALEVGDTGAGIEPAVRPHIFEPFFTTKERGQGTGLGLATVYGIVKQNRGFIGLDSDRRGSCFTVYLPATEKPLSRAVAPATRAKPGSETILLVEDEEVVREVARRSLAHYGYNVLEAANAEEALDLIAAGEIPIDLLLTDVVMPGMGGHDLAREIEEECPETQVLFVSGYNDDQIARHGVLEQGVEFLAKPYTPGILAQKVREILDRAKPGSS